jgi:hypothetical protein
VLRCFGGKRGEKNAQKRKTGPRYVDESAREIEEIGASCWGFFRREFFSSTIFRKLHDFS